MYYLTIKNLGVERCIHQSEEAIYMDGMSFSCTPNLPFQGGNFLREIRISCPEVPDSLMPARIYSD